jgi:hypothetical protein
VLVIRITQDAKYSKSRYSFLRPLRSLRLNPLIRIRPLFHSPPSPGEKKLFFVIFVVIRFPFAAQQRVPSLDRVALLSANFLAEKTAPIVGDFVLQLAAGAADFGKLLAPLVGACRVDHGA